MFDYLRVDVWMLEPRSRYILASSCWWRQLHVLRQGPPQLAVVRSRGLKSLNHFQLVKAHNCEIESKKGCAMSYSCSSGLPMSGAYRIYRGSGCATWNHEPNFTVCRKLLCPSEIWFGKSFLPSTSDHLIQGLSKQRRGHPLMGENPTGTSAANSATVLQPNSGYRRLGTDGFLPGNAERHFGKKGGHGSTGRHCSKAKVANSTSFQC